MKIKKIFSLLLCTVLILCTVISSSAESNSSDMPGEAASRYIDEAVNLIIAKYKFDVNKEDLYRDAIKHLLEENPELLESAFKGLFDSLDDYSVYYTEEELNGFMGNLEGEICGIGVLVNASESGLIIAKVYDNTPAMEGGLRQGDIITHAEGTYLGGLDIDIAKQNILGAENTAVTITVLRDGTSVEKTLVRRKVAIDAGFYQIVENGKIGYIELMEFSNTASEFISKALAEFDKNNIKDVIIDLRNNPGGGLNELVEVCSLFIPSGPAIHLEYKNPSKKITLYAENEGEVKKYNLAVIINKNSASASEAFAAAVQDTKSGIIVGETSFGKGTMQNITKFKIGGGIKLTEAVYLSPNGREVNKVGVTPDVEAIDKMSKYEKADLIPMTYERVLKIGDKGKDVQAIEERLRICGFDVGVPDEEFTYDTYLAVLNFQKNTELFPYGVMDYTTQTKLEGVLSGKEVKSDTSYKKAVELLKKGNIEIYMRDWPVEK